MKKIIIFLLFLSTKVHSQTKDTFELVSFPHYDEYGNFYRVVKKYDHIPTRKDSLDFKKESDSTISSMMREVRKDFEPKPKLKTNKKRIKN